MVLLMEIKPVGLLAVELMVVGLLVVGTYNMVMGETLVTGMSHGKWVGE